MKLIDKFLNGITMYRLVLYGLLVIVAASFAFSILGILSYTLLALAISLTVILAVGFVMHWVLVRLFKSAPSTESWLITALILFLILKPADDIAGYAVLALAVVLATVSKYIFTFGHRHIFNPVAIALVTLGLLGSGEVFWWVGSQSLLPIVVIAGLLVVRKVRRFDMVITFILAAVAAYMVSRGLSGASSLEVMKTIVLSGPLIFLATIMLTEPQTSPRTRPMRILYAVIVGALFSIPFELSPLFSSPELALVVGNIFAFIVSPKRRLRLELQGISQPGAGIYEFSFLPDKPLKFSSGQYMEWTLPHHHSDTRGDRRFFTVASAPSELDVKLAVRIDPEHSSSFKRALLAMRPGDEIWASQLAGDFTLPRNHNKKLVFIAGGIGVTPFRSQVQHLIDTQQHREMTLYYTSLTVEGFSYWEIFNQAATNGLTSRFVITGKDIPEGWTGKAGFLTAEMIQTEVPDYKKAIFYLSGPNVMVSSYKKMLRQARVPRRHIKTDYFPGF